MSWQTYVDEHLMCDVDGHRLTAAAVIGQDGCVWAQSSNFPQVQSLLCFWCSRLFSFLSERKICNFGLDGKVRNVVGSFCLLVDLIGRRVIYRLIPL